MTNTTAAAPTHTAVNLLETDMQKRCKVRRNTASCQNQGITQEQNDSSTPPEKTANWSNEKAMLNIKSWLRGTKTRLDGRKWSWCSPGLTAHC